MRNGLIGLFMLSCLTACQRQDAVADLRLWVASVNAAGSETLAMPTAMEVERVTAYSAGAERSPFRDRTPVAVGSVAQVEPQQPLSADTAQRRLVNASLDDLTLVGTLSGLPHKASQALFRDADGRIHRLAAGARVGREDARLVAITDTQVELLEKVPLVDGGWVTQTRTFVLQGQRLPEL